MIMMAAVLEALLVIVVAVVIAMGEEDARDGLTDKATGAPSPSGASARGEVGARGSPSCSRSSSRAP